MRMQDVMQALADGDAKVVDATSLLAPSDQTPTVDPIADYERQVELG
jgi:hypothetical protein